LHTQTKLKIFRLLQDTTRKITFSEGRNPLKHPSKSITNYISDEFCDETQVHLKKWHRKIIERFCNPSQFVMKNYHRKIHKICHYPLKVNDR